MNSRNSAPANMQHWHIWQSIPLPSACTPHNRRHYSAQEDGCDTHIGCKRCAATCARLKHAFKPLPCSLISFTIPSLMALATPSPAHFQMHISKCTLPNAHFQNQVMSADARQAPCCSTHLPCSYIVAATVLQDRVGQYGHLGWAQAMATPVQIA